MSVKDATLSSCHVESEINAIRERSDCQSSRHHARSNDVRR